MKILSFKNHYRTQLLCKASVAHDKASIAHGKGFVVCGLTTIKSRQSHIFSGSFLGPAKPLPCIKKHLPKNISENKKIDFKNSKKLFNSRKTPLPCA